MNKEQFLAMSLPFNLYAFVRYLENGIELSRKIKPITGYSIEKSVICGYFAKAGFFKDEEFRTEGSLLYILHPLSDLTKDEWIEKLNTFACNLLDAAHVYDEKNIVGLNWMTHPFEIVMWLIENHFDVAGLIEKGEAIDVNTLPENPYK